MDSNVEQSLGRGEGGRSAIGAPIVMEIMGTLCAHADLDCRNTDFTVNGCKTTATREPGPDDQWERGSFATNPGDDLRLVQDHLNKSGNYHQNAAENEKFNHPEEVE